MRVTLKFAKLFRARCGDVELESQGYMVQKYGIVSAILLSNNYVHICMMTSLTTVPLEKHETLRVYGAW